MIGFMSTSLKVVNIAVSFLTATNRRETVFRKLVIFSRRIPRSPAGVAGVAETVGALAFAGSDGAATGADFCADRASSLVILPSTPVPLTSVALIPFSDKIFAAAGEG